MAKLTESIAFEQINILLIRYEQCLKNILNILLNLRSEDPLGSSIAASI